MLKYEHNNDDNIFVIQKHVSKYEQVIFDIPLSLNKGGNKGATIEYPIEL